MGDVRARYVRWLFGLIAVCLVLSGGAGPLSAVASPGESPQAFSVTLSPPNVPTGGTLTVAWSAPEGRPGNDWVGLFPPGGLAGSEVWWTYTGGAGSGTVTLAAPLTSGPYQARYLLDDGYLTAATSTSINVGSGSPPQATPYTLSLTPAEVAPGQTLTVAWTAPANRHVKDWVGLYLVGQPSQNADGSGNEKWWTYTGGERTGSATLPAPVPGTYEARYFLEDSYQSSASSAPATVTTTAPVPPSTPTSCGSSNRRRSARHRADRARAEDRIRGLPRRTVRRADVELSDAAAVSDDTRSSDLSERLDLPAGQLHDVSAAEPLLPQRAVRAAISCGSGSRSPCTRSSWSPASTSRSQAGWRRTCSCSTATRSATYRQLLYEITLNPAMGNYLDITGNTRTQPERKLRARNPAAVLDRHRAAESGRHAAARWRRAADPDLHPGRRQQLRARLHRLAARAPRRRPACRTTSTRWSPTKPSTTSAQDTAERRRAARRADHRPRTWTTRSTTSSIIRTSARSSRSS